MVARPISPANDHRLDDLLRTADRWALLWIAASLVIAITLGGATRGAAISSAIVRVACLPMLILGAARMPRHGSLLLTAAVWLIAGLFLLPLLQVIPLPPTVWRALPGRQFLIEADQLAGLHYLWRPISLTPDATWNMLPALGVPTAFFLATATLSENSRRLLTLAVLTCAIGAIILGGLQMAGGPNSPLRFYAITNTDAAVGFFANRNHEAALLVATIPLAAYWTLWLLRNGGVANAASTAVFLGFIFLLTIGLGVTRSRAGVLLGMSAIAGCLVLIARATKTPGRRTLLAGVVGAVIIGGAMIAIFSLSGLTERFQEVDAMANSRTATLPTILKAGASVWPAGAGFGSFVPVYAMFEPPNAVTGFFLNHAHDDYLEFWLEGGLPAVLLAAGGMVWFAWAGLRAWTGSGGFNDRDLPRAASILILMLLIHSTLDYPLRTAAMAAVFGMACGLMVPAVKKNA